MKRRRPTLLTLVLALLAPGCTTLSGLRGPEADVPPLEAVAGSWVYDGLGTPTLDHPRLPGMIAVAANALAGSTIVVREDGGAVIERMGHAVEFRLEPGERRGDVLQLRADDEGTVLLLDPAAHRLSYGMKFEADGEQGEVPVRYKRTP